MNLYTIIISCCVLSNMLIGQSNLGYQNSNSEMNSPKDVDKNIILLNEKPGHFYSVITGNDSSQRVKDVNLTEEMNIIVEFKNKPLFIHQKEKSLSKISSISYRTQFAEFQNDISNIQESFAKQIKVSLPSVQIEKEFYKTFNGVSIKIPRGMINSLYSLNYVKKVHIDKKVGAYLHESVPLIKADSVWSKLNVRGDSIVVGILDTGIDYLHPALGGGYGEGYKVIGGYDFINEDEDPMDDHGHGTHVAGIVSADTDSIKGVAPKSLLMSFKVLDQDGFGLESQVIAGIERAVDPNNDGNYDDRVDIANMSLGDTGNPDDAQSTAVNNAVDLGVVFCIAAGNSGAYSTIGSPGTAEKAITVGSSDKSDELSFFSSKGPTSKTYSIKPDILAPGSDILSSIMGGGYEANSGTSMASPLVAGVCALLKQLHKDWSPEMIKSAVMTTSIDLSEDVMSQGAGRVDALRAIRTKTFVMPSSLSFGLDIDTTSSWNKKDTLQIINNSEIPKDYSISIDGLMPGITIDPEVSEFSLGAKESKNIEITLTVDNQIVPYLDNQKTAYEGNIYITTESENLHVPWAFVKKSLLVINTDIMPTAIEIFNKDNNYYLTTSFDPQRFELLVLPGKYTVFCNYYNFESDTKEIKYVIRENVEIDSYKEISINSTEAIHKIDFNGVAENGIEIASMSNSAIEFRIKYIGDNGGFGILHTFNDNREFLISTFNEFSIYARQLQADIVDEKIRIVNYQPKIGLNNSYQFINSVNDFVVQDINISLNSYKDTNKVLLGSAQFFGYNEYYMFGGAYPYLNIVDKFSGELYINRDGDYEDHIRTFLITDYITNNETRIFPPDGSWFISGYFKARNDTVFTMPFMYSSPSHKGNIYKQINGGVLNFGEGAIYNRLKSYNTSSKIEIYSDFFGQLNELRESDVYHSFFQIFDEDDNVIQSDSLQNFTPLEVPTGKYKYVVENNNFIIGKHKGSSRTISEFDLFAHYPYSPTVRSLQIINSSETVTSNLKSGEKAKLLFSIYGGSKNNKVYLKESSDVEWNEVEVRDTSNYNIFGEYYVVDLNKFAMIDSTAIDLKIISEHPNNNSKYTYILKPAFVVSYWDGIVDVEEIEDLILTPQKYSLSQNYPNPFNPSTSIKYSLPNESKVSLKIYNTLGEEVSTLVNIIQKSGNYEIDFDASNLSSGVYFYRLKTDHFVDTKKFILLR